MVYAADSLALATLEYFVHVPPELRAADKLPALTAIQIELPPDAGVDVLPPDWPHLDDRARTRAFGDAWVQDRRSLALRVPSRVVPVEWNLLLNPDHPGMATVRVLRTEPFALDRRLGA